MDTTYSKNTHVKLKLLLLVLLLAIASFYALSINTDTFNFINYNSHATSKHGTEATEVRTCLSDYGGVHKFYNPKTNRFAEICFMENGKFGIQITEEENEITSFIKNKMSTLKQVIRYLESGGYTNNIY